jgi:O-antigen/teichoic acid export membrane protein
VARNLVGGTSALGLGVIIERGFGFLANLLAARLGGASTFGAYSLAITTASNISTYAAGGIGSTAVRFSGKYPNDSQGYGTLAKALLIISLVSAILAASGLWAGTAALAHLLGKDSLTGLLHWAALSAAGMIMLECCRGFLVGQRLIGAILLLSSAVGIGLITLLPAASRVGPVRMITSQGCITLGAVLLCLLFYKPLGLAPSRNAATSRQPLGPMLRGVWSFGLIQLAGMIGMNAAGWWLTSLIAKADTTMVQVGLFAIANQLRNMVSLAPGLLSESGLAVMAHGENDEGNMASRVMALCTFITIFTSLLVAGLAITIIPWGLTALYGHSYAPAAAACCISLATAVVHMGSAPASAQLTIISIRLTGVINTIWALLVASSATLLFLGRNVAGGNLAWIGALIYLGAHLASAFLVIAVLWKRNSLPRGVAKISILGWAMALLLALLAFLRLRHPALTLPISLLMLALCLVSSALILRVGHLHHWVPSITAIKGLLRTKGILPSLAVEPPTSGGFDA